MILHILLVAIAWCIFLLIYKYKSNAKATPSVLSEANKSRPPVHYGFIWLVNFFVTSIALFFYVVIDSETSEFLDDFQGLVFLAIPSIFLTLVVISIEAVLFFITKRIINRQSLSPVTARRWLFGPACAFVIIIVVAGVWNLMPRQRLAKVCNSKPSSARNIQVVGCSGLLIGEWLAVFNVQTNDFQELVRKNQLQIDATFDLVEKLNRAVFVKRSSLVQSLPVFKSSQCFKQEFKDDSGRVRGGIYALYDPATSKAVVFREYHD